MWDIDLSDTDLDFLDTDIPSKHSVCLQDVSKTSSRDVFKTSSRHVFKMSWKTKNCYAEDVLKTCKCLMGIFSTSEFLHLQDSTYFPLAIEAKILCLKSFGNSWGNFCIHFLAIIIWFRFTWVNTNSAKKWKSLQMFCPRLY